MTDLFEQRLTRALTSEAARAPLARREWAHRHEPMRRPSTPRLVRYTAAAAVAGVVAGAAVTMYATRDGAHETIRSIATPPAGTEVPMVPASSEPADLLTGFVVKPGSAYAFTVGDRRFDVSESMSWSGVVGRGVDTQMCSMPDTGGGLCVVSGGESWATDLTSGGGLGAVYAGGLPDDIAYVTVTIGEDTFWQDPLHDFGVFPFGPGGQPYEATAVLADGTTIDLTGNETTPDSGATPETDQYPAGTSDDARSIMNSVGQACLDDAGVTDPLEPVPAGVDIEAVWDECIEQANSAIDASLEFVAADDTLARLQHLSAEAGGEQTDMSPTPTG